MDIKTIVAQLIFYTIAHTILIIDFNHFNKGKNME